MGRLLVGVMTYTFCVCQQQQQQQQQQLNAASGQQGPLVVCDHGRSSMPRSAKHAWPGLVLMLVRPTDVRRPAIARLSVSASTTSCPPPSQRPVHTVHSAGS